MVVKLLYKLSDIPEQFSEGDKYKTSKKGTAYKNFCFDPSNETEIKDACNKKEQN